VGVGLFFTGGVDSFFSLISHFDEVTHLIFVIGFDIDIDDIKLSEEVVSALSKIALRTKKKLILVKTNLRKLSNKHLTWEQYHGAALAGVALAHSNLLREVIIPSSFSNSELFPWGSHPDLDSNWSSGSTRIIHDSVSRSRSEKIRVISTNQLALDNLRVCWENRGSEYNCGKCEKCLRTMISLFAYGSLHKCETLPKKLKISSLLGIPISNKASKTFAADNLNLLKSMPRRRREIEIALSLGATLGWARGTARKWAVAQISIFTPRLFILLKSRRKPR
jgi:hypothetical protein